MFLFFLLSFLLLNERTALAANGGFFQNNNAGGSTLDDPYKVLGVDRSASNEEIQKAYRQKARETHREYGIVVVAFRIVRFFYAMMMYAVIARHCYFSQISLW